MICEVEKNGKDVRFNRLNLIRIPLRLGFDVFEKGSIEGKKKRMLIDTIKAFKQIMKIYDVEHYIACATSAMRDASNSKDIIREIREETNIEIDIITGDTEAEIIYENHFAELLNGNKPYLYIDVGGGSTELTLYHKDKIRLQKSYNIGTVRFITGKIKDEAWEKLREDLKKLSAEFPLINGIGSGGNINKVLTISKANKIISYEELKNIYSQLSSMTIGELMNSYSLKRDRADVIVPALFIYTNIMKWANIQQLHVPKIGLVDGLIKHLYEQVK
jgi:exopolyphosphatase/guanosine-5'-triphosphate,3'-diphosphate pyrophosphatase